MEVHTVVLVIVQLCQRNSGKMDENERQVRCVLMSVLTLTEMHNYGN